MAGNGGDERMKIYDVSMLIYNEMMTYENRVVNRPQIESIKTFEKDGFNESTLKLNLHTGTHVDAQFHMINQGETVEKHDLNKLVTKCRVLDLTCVDGRISQENLIKFEIKKDEFILFKTKNSYSEIYPSDSIFLDSTGAKFLADLSISGVGIDSLGIERSQPDHATHKILMEQGIIILEGLRLKDVPQGEYFMCALPLKLQGTDGAPARVILIDGLGTIPAGNSDFLTDTVFESDKSK